MIHAGKINPARARSNKFHSQLVRFGLSSWSVAAEKQRRHRRGAAGKWRLDKIFWSAGKLLKLFMDIKNLNDVAPFITKDGSEIRELLAHRNSAVRNQSVAEARLPAGASTQEHFHPKAEEIYYITHGVGRMRIEGV